MKHIYKKLVLIIMLLSLTGCSTINETSQEPVASESESIPDIVNSVRFGTDNLGYIVINNCNSNTYRKIEDGYTADVTKCENVTNYDSTDSVWANSGIHIKVNGKGNNLTNVRLVNVGNCELVDHYFSVSGTVERSHVISETVNLINDGVYLDVEKCNTITLADWNGIVTDNENEKEAAFLKEFNDTYYLLYFSGNSSTFDKDCSEVLESFTPPSRKQTVGILATSGFGDNNLDYYKRLPNGQFGILDTEKDSNTLYSMNLKEAGIDTSDDCLTPLRRSIQTTAGYLKNNDYSFVVLNKNKYLNALREEHEDSKVKTEEVKTPSGKASVTTYETAFKRYCLVVYDDIPFIIRFEYQVVMSTEPILDFVENLRFEKIIECEL